MVILQWSHDSRLDWSNVVYFTLGTPARQKRDAIRYAAQQHVDLRRGYVRISDSRDARRAHPELQD